MILNLIDSGVGSLEAVKHLINRCGYKPNIARSADEIIKNEISVLPGVGNISEMSKGLISRNLFDYLKKADSKVIGICVGFQILFEKSEEDHEAICLSRVKNNVVKVNTLNSNMTPRMGWDYVMDSQLNTIGKYYFAHSFGVGSENVDAEKKFFSKTNTNILAALFDKNICGIQFHPEKSHQQGEEFFQKAINYLSDA